MTLRCGSFGFDGLPNPGTLRSVSGPVALRCCHPAAPGEGKSEPALEMEKLWSSGLCTLCTMTCRQEETVDEDVAAWQKFEVGV